MHTSANFEGHAKLPTQLLVLSKWFLQAHWGLLFTIISHKWNLDNLVGSLMHLGLKTGPKEQRLNEKLVGRMGNDEK